jgi:sister-chromatid-cohesion protein PDS5
MKTTLILGKFDNKLNISRKVFDLIYELNMICPRILLTVLPQLEFKIKSTDEGERMGSVSLLARMFSEKGSNLAKNHRPLWLAFLGRYNDISVAIRTKCVQVSTCLFSSTCLFREIREGVKLTRWVKLLARIFSEKGSNLAKNHRPLWLTFL